jgi:hypothetical protein
MKQVILLSLSIALLFATINGLIANSWMVFGITFVFFILFLWSIWIIIINGGDY